LDSTVTYDIEELQMTPQQILHHAYIVQEKYGESPAFGVRYLEELLKNNGYIETNDVDIASVWIIIEELRALAQASGDTLEIGEKDMENHENEDILQRISQEIVFRKQIEEFYLPKQLIDAIMELGEIPKNSMETTIGIGFIDIADYTFLSKFLSPQENQVVLNGLYTAFHYVLRRHGGYLNKIEGDSMMFHFGGIIDPNVKELKPEHAVKYISKELFYTCIEMQRVCVLFNQANDKFIEQNADRRTREYLERSFSIISMLRNNLELASSINALFQIRIRIGANIGEVTIGNFGPQGAKQWDVVGLPVIDAKRMEMTAPVGGLRISEEFYNHLEKIGIVEAYFRRFKREAQALGGTFKNISKEDLFKFSIVNIKEKKDAVFRTYSVQVNPGLPEAIADQVALLLEKGDAGAGKILELLQYYRGNRYVIEAIEKIFRDNRVMIRKVHILKIIYPKKYQAFLKKLGNDRGKTVEFIEENYTLFKLFEKLGGYQDKVKLSSAFPGVDNDFVDYESWFEKEKKLVKAQYRVKKRSADQTAYFYNMVYPLVFISIRASIIEHQRDYGEEELEELSEE
jgi:adenylate cyclase